MNNVIELKQYRPEGYGDIIFIAHEYGPVLTIKANGEIFYKDKLIKTDKEIINALRQFLAEAGYMRNE